MNKFAKIATNKISNWCAMKITQHQLSEKVGYSQQMISAIINGLARPSWPKAKLLSKATNTSPELWLEGTSEQIRKALKALAENEEAAP